MKKSFSFSLFAVLSICFFVFTFTAQAVENTEHKLKNLSVSVSSKAKRVTLLGFEFVLVQGSALPKHIQAMHTRWDEIMAQHKGDIFSAKNIPLKGVHKDQWKALTKITKKSPQSLKTLRNINGFFNKMLSKKDVDVYGAGEYWATPYEFLHNGGGDCEDYAITKYFALTYFGWDSQKLWVVLLHENIRNTGHSVLIAQDKKGFFVLDNLSKPAHLLIPAKQYAKNVTPFALVNDNGLWLRVNSKKKTESVGKTQP